MNAISGTSRRWGVGFQTAASRIWHLAAALAVVCAAGCFREPDEKTPVEPRIVPWAFEDAPPSIAHVTGTEVVLDLSWAARCTYDGWLPDTGETELCDEQPFRATVSCDGPCELDPPELATGLELDGAGTAQIRLVAPGDVDLEVTLEHLETGQTFRRSGQLAVRDREALVIDCVVQPYDAETPRCEQRDGFVLCQDVPYEPCSTEMAIDPQWGTPIEIWVYSVGDGYPLAPGSRIPGTVADLSLPEVTFADLEPRRADTVRPDAHADPRAAPVARAFKMEGEEPGMLAIHASQGGFAADLESELVFP